MSEKKAKERLELFQQKGQFRDPGDPRLILLDRVLNEMSMEEQIKCIINLLKPRELYEFSSRHIEQAKTLITALKKLFHELDRELPYSSGVFYSQEEGKAYVECLMDVYRAILIPAKKYEPEYQDPLGFAIEVRLALLSEIAGGWSSTRSFSDSCFQFLCWAYREDPTHSYGDKSEVQRGILEIIRKMIENQGVQELNKWIVADKVPYAIVETLLKGRTRSLGYEGKQEVAFLEVFDLHNRDSEAIERVKALMKEIRETEECGQLDEKQ